ncbi:hypothetical protein D4692_19190 [Escherichia coli]|nr:hypothetical protein [Escherichia coli]EEW8308299.1 hypothetical protein [Escherichia coli]EFN9749401.1 hypothetical protein [Escherichia coli]
MKVSLLGISAPFWFFANRLFALSFAALTAFGVAASDSLVLSTALLSFTTPLVVRLASSIATAPAISSARSAAASARVAADSAAVLL